MNHKAAIEIIVEIERQFEVNSLYYKDLRIWPLIRWRIWKKLVADTIEDVSKRTMHGRTNVSFASRRKGIVKIPYRIFKAAIKYSNNWHRYSEQITSLHRNGVIDFLFFSWPEYYTDQICGKSYNRQLDPIIELVKNSYRFCKIELFSDKGAETIPRSEPTIFVDPSLYVNNPSFVRIMQRFKQVVRANHIKGFQELTEALSRVPGNIQLEEENIINSVLVIERYQAFFTEILSLLKPKAVFASGVFRVPFLGMLWACSNLGITTVEIQHGKGGKYNLKYAKWSRIPKEGYQLLVDYCWCWGQESKSIIEEGHPKGCRHHIPVVGGNRWLGKWLEDGEMIIKGALGPLEERFDQAEKVILVSLQPINTPMPTHMLDAITNSPPYWYWLIRLHPTQREQKGNIRALMKRHGIQNAEIDYATEAPLYALLKRSDHHVTCWSSVCYEALAFSVPTTIVHPVGLEYFNDYINQGLFTYAQNSDELLAAIGKYYAKDQLREPTPYIETSKERAEEALKIIIS